MPFRQGSNLRIRTRSSDTTMNAPASSSRLVVQGRDAHHDGLVSGFEAPHVDLLLGDPRGVRNGGSYAALVDRRVVAGDVSWRLPSGQRVEHDGHENARTADARLPVTRGFVDRDLLEQFIGLHINSVPTVSINGERVGDSGDRC